MTGIHPEFSTAIFIVNSYPDPMASPRPGLSLIVRSPKLDVDRNFNRLFCDKVHILPAFGPELDFGRHLHLLVGIEFYSAHDLLPLMLLGSLGNAIRCGRATICAMAKQG